MEELSDINCPNCDTNMQLRIIVGVLYRECPDCGYIEEHVKVVDDTEGL